MEPGAGGLTASADVRAVADVLQSIELDIGRQPIEGALDRSAVEALDVIGHALAFVHHPRALELWRTALWERRLTDETRGAVALMLEFLGSSLAQGRHDEVSRICDCLHVIVSVGSDCRERQTRIADDR